MSAFPPLYEPLQQPSDLLGINNEASLEDKETADLWLARNAKLYPPRQIKPDEVPNISAFGWKRWNLVQPRSSDHHGEIRHRFKGILEVSPKLRYGITEVTTKRDCQDVTLLSNLPMHLGLYDTAGLQGVYYEITIEKMKGVIALGMTPIPFPQFRLPGWERGIGLHLDDMHVFLEDNCGGRPLADGRPEKTLMRNRELKDQVFGCGFDYALRTVFFTHNGERLEDMFLATSSYFPHDIYAAVGFSDSDDPHWSLSSEVNKFTVNFGGEPFKYDVANSTGWRRHDRPLILLNDAPPAYPSSS